MRVEEVVVGKRERERERTRGECRGRKRRGRRARAAARAFSRLFSRCSFFLIESLRSGSISLADSCSRICSTLSSARNRKTAAIENGSTRERIQSRSRMLSSTSIRIEKKLQGKKLLSLSPPYPHSTVSAS